MGHDRSALGERPHTRAALQVAADLVTDRQREAARAAFTWRTVDAELAELLHDSALESAAVRGADDAARTLPARVVAVAAS